MSKQNYTRQKSPTMGRSKSTISRENAILADRQLSPSTCLVRYYHHHLYLTPLMPPRTRLSLTWGVNRAMPCDTRAMHIVDYGIVVTMNRVPSAGLSRHILQGKKFSCAGDKKVARVSAFGNIIDSIIAR